MEDALLQYTGQNTADRVLQTDVQRDICDCRVTFTTENSYVCSICNKKFSYLQETCLWITIAGVKERKDYGYPPGVEARKDENYPDEHYFLKLFKDFYVPRMRLPLR